MESTYLLLAVLEEAVRVDRPCHKTPLANAAKIQQNMPNFPRLQSELSTHGVFVKRDGGDVSSEFAPGVVHGAG